MKMEEDLTQTDSTEYMKYIKKLKKDGTIKEVREVAKDYRLQENEEESTGEEYIIDQKKVLSELISKTKKKEENKKVVLGEVILTKYATNVNQFYQTQPFFYDVSKIFWFWQKEKNCYEIVDEIDVMNGIDDSLQLEGVTVNQKLKTNYIEAFKRIGRKNKPKDAKIKWIQFKDKAYDLMGHTHIVNHKYFFTNPIPWDIGESTETPVLDKLFKEWVGEGYVDTLYEIVAYCCYRGYPIQSLFCLYGSGRNGKSCFLRILKKFLGNNNICSTELDLLMNTRFESFKLYKKLACFMGETNLGTMTKSSLLKKLVGGDLIGFEKKNKDPFDADNYAKIIIASNSLPSSDDTSEGFYRRWIIIDFPNEFPEGKDIVESVPRQEYVNLAKKVTQILPKLLERGTFTNQGSIKERENKYIMASNPLPQFIKQCCIIDESGSNYISYNELYNAYCHFLKVNKRRRVKQKEFKTALQDEGFYPEKTSKKIGDFEDVYKILYWIDGLSLKGDWKNFAHFNDFAQVSTYISIYKESKWRIKQKKQNEQKINENVEVIDMGEDLK